MHTQLADYETDMTDKSAQINLITIIKTLSATL
jgi:hypothetical protein